MTFLGFCKTVQSREVKIKTSDGGCITGMLAPCDTESDATMDSLIVHDGHGNDIAIRIQSIVHISSPPSVRSEKKND